MTTRSCSGALALGLVLGLGNTAAVGFQTRGTVAGRVVTDDAGSGIAGAVITIRSEAQPEVVAITDDDGQFSVAALGDTVLTVAKTGYSVSGGVSGANRITLNIMPGATKVLTLRMVRTGVLAGTIRDVAGQPIPGALVFAIDARDENVLLLPWYGRPSTHATATTDRYGRYRLSDLATSSYFILAQPTLDPNATVVEDPGRSEVDKALSLLAKGLRNLTTAGEVRQRVLAPLFYPGSALRSRALAVRVDPGAEVDGLDFVLDAIDVRRISGTVVGVEPDMIPGLELALEAIDSATGLQTSTRPRLTLRPDASGRFQYDNVPAGSYRVMGRLGSRDSSGQEQVLYGTSQVSVAGSNVTDLVLVMRPAARVRGSIDVRSAKAAFPDLGLIRFRLVAVGSSPSAGFFRPPPPTLVRTDGAFDLGWLAPGMYTLLPDMPATMRQTWWFRSALVDEREVLDLRLLVAEKDLTVRVVLTDDSSGLSGYVRNEAGSPSMDITVLLFSAERTFWYRDSRRVRVAQTGTDGSYSLLQIPTGDYYLAAFREDSLPDRSASGLARIAPLAARIRIAGDRLVVRDLVVK